MPSVTVTTDELRAVHRFAICWDCGGDKPANRWRKCARCHRANVEGLRRIMPAPFYLAPLDGTR